MVFVTMFLVIIKVFVTMFRDHHGLVTMLVIIMVAVTMFWWASWSLWASDPMATMIVVFILPFQEA